MSDEEIEQELHGIMTRLDADGALPDWMRLVRPADPI
jgi:hypothetical protein